MGVMAFRALGCLSKREEKQMINRDQKYILFYSLLFPSLPFA